MVDGAKLKKPMSRGRGAGLRIALAWLFVLALVASAGVPSGNAIGTAIRTPLISPGLPVELFYDATVLPRFLPPAGSACATAMPAAGAALGAWTGGASGIPPLRGCRPGGATQYDLNTGGATTVNFINHCSSVNYGAIVPGAEQRSARLRGTTPPIAELRSAPA